VRTFLRIVANVLTALLLPITVGAVHASATFGAVFAPRADASSVAPPPRLYDPAKPTAAVVLGTHGTVASDALAPYEILAASGAFNVYTVAQRAAPVPLSGGLDVVPDMTLAQLDARLGPRHPDLVVVPALRDLGTDAEAPLTGWLRQVAAAGTLMQSVCNGAEVLAAAGLLDGRRATAHWAAVADYAKRYPKVDWFNGPRFVEDGSDRLTTGGILAGIDGTLRVVERLVGPAAAVHAASSIQYGRYVPGPARSLAPVEHSAADAVAVLNAASASTPPRSASH
jgi:transcriptional regulator GlxA family with amidase domain